MVGSDPQLHRLHLLSLAAHTGVERSEKPNGVFILPKGFFLVYFPKLV